jgi:peptide deformylase
VRNVARHTLRRKIHRRFVVRPSGRQKCEFAFAARGVRIDGLKAALRAIAPIAPIALFDPPQAPYNCDMLPIVIYPHPALRHKSKPLKRLDAEVRRVVQEMFETMYTAKGIGLAANQVDLPYRLFIVNEKGDPAEKDFERVFINPVLSNKKGMGEEEEGCLSLPCLYRQVKRPEQVTVAAYDLSGKPFRFDLDGLLARIVQHENDHLDGVLFTDRLSVTQKADVRQALEEFEVEYQQKRSQGQFPEDAAIAARLAELEAARC